jgi:hypothetical protein
MKINRLVREEREFVNRKGIFKANRNLLGKQGLVRQTAMCKGNRNL